MLLFPLREAQNLLKAWRVYVDESNPTSVNDSSVILMRGQKCVGVCLAIGSPKPLWYGRNQTIGMGICATRPKTKDGFKTYRAS
jgi:hypothetical protein